MYNFACGENVTGELSGGNLNGEKLSGRIFPWKMCVICTRVLQDDTFVLVAQKCSWPLF